MAPIVRHSAALLIAAASLAAGADELGTLFHTPQERARLDRLRRGEPVNTAQAGTTGPAVARRPVVTGYVQRSDGRNTVWIDGRPVVVATPNANRLLDPRVVQSPPRREEEPQPPDPEEKR